MTREEALNEIKSWDFLEGKEIEAIHTLIPELRKSEDERIRMELKEAFEAYDIESKWNGIPVRSIFAWLEKQKEPENTSASTMAPSCWAEEQKEQEPVECIEDSVKFEEGFKAGRESGLRDGQKYVLNNLDSYGLCKLAEWSEEDKEKIVTISEIIEHCTTIPYSGGTLTLNKEYKKELLCFIKSLRPQYHGDVTMTEAYKMGLEAGKASSWKPSAEQMDRLFSIVAALRKDYCDDMADFLANLHADLKKLGVKEEPEY